MAARCLLTLPAARSHRLCCRALSTVASAPQHFFLAPSEAATGVRRRNVYFPSVSRPHCLVECVRRRTCADRAGTGSHLGARARRGDCYCLLGDVGAGKSAFRCS